MPKRYFIGKRPKAVVWDDFDPEDAPNAENYLGHYVFEPEPQIVDTGLLDSHGNPICYEERLDQIGFWREGY